MQSLASGFFAVALLASPAWTVWAAVSAPDQVVQAAENRFPETEIIEVDRDREDGEVVYELTLKGADHRIEAEFLEDGTFVKSEEESLPWSQVPNAVRTPFKNAYPNVKHPEITRVTRAITTSKGEGVVYIFEFRDQNQEREMSIDSQGTVLFDRQD